ncbi:MAG: DUF3810 domain-containing protein [Prolixibacteraceae bacterium]|nr:DUF3810 domain-containing protein [Prolixibacteraceae bacterium]
MAKNKITASIFGRSALPIWIALATFGLTELLSRYPAVTESVYSQTIYTLVASVLSFISKMVQFSIADVFYAVLTIFLISLLVLPFFTRLKWGKSLLLFVQTAAICYALFYWFWGFNYYRSGINERLSIAKSKPDTVQLVRVFEKLIAETNAAYCSFDSISKPEIVGLVESSYQKHASFLKIDYPNGTRVPKPITISNFFAKAGIAGYYGPFFSEAHLNDSLLMVEYPAVLAHEYAHQFGITSEAEANFYGWLVCSRSESKHLRYSVNLGMTNYFLAQTKRLHSFPRLVHQIDKRVIADIRNMQQHWARMRNEKIDKAAGKVNDAYLKTHKIEKGIEDYFGVVQFVMDFETDPDAQKRSRSSSD